MKTVIIDSWDEEVIEGAYIEYDGEFFRDEKNLGLYLQSVAEPEHFKDFVKEDDELFRRFCEWMVDTEKDFRWVYD